MIKIFSYNKVHYTNRSKFTILSNIEDLPNGIVFYLIRTGEDGEADTVKSVKSKNGTFLISGSLKVEPELYFVKMDTSVIKIAPRQNSWIRLLLDNSSVSLTGSLRNWPNIGIEGSVPTVQYDSLTKLINKEYDEANVKIKSANRDKIAISD